jgi:hypothetical protein
MLMLKKLMDPNFEPLRSMGSMAMIRPKSQNTSMRHDGAISIRNLVRNKAQLIISLFINRPTTKKCAPYFRGNMEFPFYLNKIFSFLEKYRWKNDIFLSISWNFSKIGLLKSAIFLLKSSFHSLLIQLRQLETKKRLSDVTKTT